MPDDRESPSAGWREVYDEMETDTGIEEVTHFCPDCGRVSENLVRDVYECEEHGLFRSSATDEGASSESDASAETDPGENEEGPNRTHGTAD